MAITTREMLQRQIRRVRRRLFLQTLGRRLVFLALVGLLLYTGFLVYFGVRSQAWSLTSGVFRDRLLELAGVVGLVGGVSMLLAWMSRPTLSEAALSIDESFQLQQRVTTCLSLGASEEASPAGQAVLADTKQHTEKLALRKTYPLTPSGRSTLLIPALGLTVAAMLFCDAWPTPPDPDAEPVTPQMKAELEDVTKRMREMTPPKQNKGDKAPRSREFDKIAAEIERLAGEKPKTQGEAREMIKDMTSLEDRMRRLEKSLAERADALQKQGEEADRLSKKKKPNEKPTPQEQAMKEGDMRAAADDLKRLTREMQQGNLTSEQREKLEKQISDLKEHLDRLAEAREKQNKDRENELKDKLDAEQLADLNGIESRDLADLKEAAEALEKAMKALESNDEREALRQLAEAAEKMGQVDPKGDQEGLARQLAMLQAMKERVGRQMGNDAASASGKRPEAAERDLKGREIKSTSERTQGGLSGFRFVPGEGLREPKSPEELRGLIDEAGREAAESAQRQRLPRTDAEMTRGFYEKLRGDPKK